MSHDRILIKGNEAVAFGALDAGCRCYFGYPITPQNEIPETMSLRLPECGGQFVQAESEVAAINMLLGAGAQQHVDGGHFAFGLHELAAAFGQPEGHGLGDLVLRRDGIAEIAAAAGVQGAKGHSFIALDENAVVTHAVFSVFLDLKTRMATSGHMSAQEAQPVQRPSVSITS